MVKTFNPHARPIAKHQHIPSAWQLPDQAEMVVTMPIPVSFSQHAPNEIHIPIPMSTLQHAQPSHVGQASPDTGRLRCEYVARSGVCVSKVGGLDRSTDLQTARIHDDPLKARTD
jgi:hypothetical protein